MDLRSGTTTKTDNVISSTASVETENEFADTKIAVETENGDYSECVSTETSVDTDNEKHSEFDPEHSVEMDNENFQFVDSDNSVVTENGVQNEITLSSLAGMLSRLGDIMCENKHELHTSMTRLEEKIDRNQNDIYQFNNSMKIMEDKLNNSTADIARLGKNVTDQFHAVGNEIGHVKNNFKNIVPQLKTDLRKDLKVELTGILKQEISVIKDTLQQEITVIVQEKNDSLRDELLFAGDILRNSLFKANDSVADSLRTELAQTNDSLRDELTSINDSLQANLASTVGSLWDELLNATDSMRKEVINANDSLRQEFVTSNNSFRQELSEYWNEKFNTFIKEIHAELGQHNQKYDDLRQEFSGTLKKELQANSDALQNEIKNNFVASMDEIMSVRKATETLNKEVQSNSQALRDEIKNNSVATSKKIMAAKTATEKSVKELDDKLSNYAQNIDAKLSESRQNYDRLFAFTQGLDKKLTRNIQKHDALEKKVLDSLDVIKKENQLVDSNFSTLETRLNEIEKSVCSTVGIAQPGYQDTPHLSTPSPVCYPSQNACQTSCQSQSALPVTCNMPVPPPSHIPIAHSTSQGMSQAGGYQNQGSVNLSSVNQSSGSQPSGNQGSRNQGSANQNSINQSSVNADCKPKTLKKPENIAPKFPVYNLGECFHNFITIYESILQRYGMMDEAALRLPECLSLPALSLYFSLPEGVRSNYKQTVAALRGFWPALPGVSNFDDLNENYGLPILKQGHNSIEIFAPKVCSVASEIANGDTQRFNRLAKYLLWKGLSVDVTIWMDKCYDDSITFADFYILCRRLLNDPPPRRSPSTGSSQYSYHKGLESPNWRERSSPQTQSSGSMSPNWREKNYSSFKPEQGSMTSAIQNGSSRRSSSISPSRNKTYSQCYGCREYGHHRYECPRRNISPSRRWSGRNSSNSPPRARYPRPGERY